MKRKKTKYIFTVAGWSYPDWAGIVYPSPRPRGFDDLSFIATYFDAIELNNTFYRIPESKMVESWIKRVSHKAEFVFTAKLFQGFTHTKSGIKTDEVRQYKKALEPMVSANRLGCLLAQYPVSFKNEEGNRERLADLIKYFEGLPLVVEFRHRSWVDQETFAWLEEQKIGYCNVDEPMFRKMIKPSGVVTCQVAYVRFHGRNYQNWFKKEATRDDRYDYLYSENELDDWIPRIKEMGEKATDVFVVGNNHFRGQAPANILQLKSKIVEGPVEVPPPMLESFPQLKKISKKEKTLRRKQASLFEDS